MSDGRNLWTREETILAFELYCTLPKGQDRVGNEEVKKLSEAMERPVNSVKLKLQNFKSYDKSYTQQGRTGLRHGSKIDEEVCLEFFDNWDNLVVEANDIKIKRGLMPADENTAENNVTSVGYDKVASRSERIGQTFFRETLLAIYDNKCCFTGMDVTRLLRASHIKPWSESNDINEKTNPRNGLLLNAL
jgi:putative restriction endonuclease